MTDAGTPDAPAAPRERPPATFWLCMLTVAVLGAVHTLATLHIVYPDTIPYLDLSDFALAGETSALVHGYWSPFYPVLLALARAVASPSAAAELSLAHWLHFALYLAAFGSYWYFVVGLRRSLASPDDTREGEGRRLAPSGMFPVFATALFLWLTLVLTDLMLLTPDMLVAVIVFAMAGLLVRSDESRVQPAAMISLGALAGLAYLTKTALLPFGIPFLVVAALRGRDWRTRAARLALSLAALVAIAGPYVLALSREKSRPTIGDSGRLNYAWFVNDVKPITHWQGGPPGSGTPLHPTRRLPGDIEAYEFATPIPGTYPAWFDASYWYEGVIVRVGPLRMLRRSVQNVWSYLALLLPVVVALVVLVRLRGTRAAIRDVRRSWPIWLAPLPALAGYSMLYLESRYVGPFLALLVLGLLAALRDVPIAARRTLAAAILLALTVAFAFPVASSSASRVRDAARSLRSGRTSSEDVAIASALRARGVEPGTLFASVGPALNGYWARVARGRVIAEVPNAAIPRYWSSTPDARNALLDEFAARGARVAVATLVPPWADTEGWQPLARGAYVRFLESRATAGK